MNIEEIEKALNEAGVDAGVITAVKGLNNSAEVERLTSELKAEQGKSAQFLTDKKVLKDKLEAAESKVKEIETSTLTVDEKWQKQLEAQKQETQAIKDQLEAEKASVLAEKREAEILKIASGLNGADGVAASTLNTLVKSALAEVEDLGDGDAVTAKINDLKENNKGLFAADTTAGTGGTHQSGGSGNQGDKPMSMKEIMAENWK